MSFPQIPMKPYSILILLVASAAATQAQSTLDFSNYKPGRVVAPVYDVDGITRLGDQYLGQLYAGSTANNLTAVGSPVRFRTHAGTNTGYIVAGRVDVPGGAGVAPVFLELRAWLASGGSTYETALAARVKTGRSAVIHIMTGGGAIGAPPAPPPALIGLSAFSLQPPPAGPSIANINSGGAQVDISFTTEPAFTYHLESKDALVPALPWVMVPDSFRTGNGAVLTVPDARPRSSTNRFYRAVMTP